MLSIKSWLFPSRDTPNGGPADADADNGQNPPASESIYVPPAKPKRASIPDAAGSGTGTVISDSKVLRRFSQRSAKFMSRGNQHDPIEDDEPTPILLNRRSATAKVTHKSPVRGRPKKDSTDSESHNTRQKDEKIEATRLLGDAKRQDRRQNWSDTDAEPEHSKREKDAVDILVPENKRREDHNFVVDLPGQMQFKKTFSVGSLRPLNTFDRQPNPIKGRDQFRSQVASTTKDRVSNHSQQDHHYQEGNASKKPRMGEMPTSARRERSNISKKHRSSIDNDELQHSSDMESTPATANGRYVPQENSIFKNRQTANRGAAAVSGKPSRNSHQVQTKSRETIDITSDDEMAGYEFTKEARRERERDGLFGYYKDSSPLQESIRHKVNGSKSPYFPDFSDSGSTPGVLREIFDDPQRAQKVSGAFQADEGSPDPVQFDPQPVRSDQSQERRPLHKSPNIGLANATNGNAMATPTCTRAAGRATSKGRQPINYPEQTFPLKGLRFRRYAEFDQYLFVVDENAKNYTINVRDQLLEDRAPLFTPVPLKMIRKAVFGRDPSHKIIFRHSIDNNKGAVTNAAGQQMVLDLGSRKSVSDLAILLEKLGVVVEERPSAWLDKVYCAQIPEENFGQRNKARPPEVVAEKHRTADDFNAPTEFANATTMLPNTSGKREKHAGRDTRQPANHSDRPREFKGSTIISGVEGRGKSPREYVLAESEDQRTEVPVRPPTDPLPASGLSKSAPRSTRSSGRYTNGAGDEEFKTSKALKPRYSENPGLGPPWKSPLVFPKTGKKREAVNFDDLQRFDNDEFLNDSLVGFFLRYLDHHLEHHNSQVWKRVSFFNSYFYERLTQAQKGKKGINYDGVDKWTKNINIFSRDFIIVPVNENLHWYVAIICNLTYFQDQEERRQGIVVGDNELEEPVSITTDPGDEELSIDQFADGPDHRPRVKSGQFEEAEDARSSFQDMTLDDAEHVSLREKSPVSPGPVSSSQTKRGPGRRKTPRRSLPKYNPDLPVIITLDSLGSGRSATCTALRQYIVLEAKKKQGWDIDGQTIRGMTAKDIPTQGNYSDCGLYLCAYMEMFILDPYAFVRRILQREPQQWPEMESEDLRTRFRDLVVELHRDQEGQTNKKPIPEVGKILLPTFKPAADAIDSSDPIELPKSFHGKNGPQPYEWSMEEQQRSSQLDGSSGAQEAMITSASQGFRELNEPGPAILIPDDDPETPDNPPAQSAARKDYSKKHGKSQNTTMTIPDDPKEFAQVLARNRSPEKHRKQRQSPISGERHAGGALREAKMKPSPEKPRRKRAQTIDTDFLTGIESYADLSDEGELADEKTEQSEEGATGSEPEEMLIQ